LPFGGLAHGLKAGYIAGHHHAVIDALKKKLGFGTSVVQRVFKEVS
jgi:hypothetical protein